MQAMACKTAHRCMHCAGLVDSNYVLAWSYDEECSYEKKLKYKTDGIPPESSDMLDILHLGALRQTQSLLLV